MEASAQSKLPVYFWIIGVLALLWNAMGAIDYTMTQTHNEAYLASLSDEQRAFIGTFPGWAVTGWALGVWGALAGSLLLLMKSRHAVTAFIVSLLGLIVSSLFQYVFAGVNYVNLFGTATILFSLLIWVIAIALLLYSRAMVRKGFLR